MASLNSLGLGSDGVLSFDVIDQLRDVDNTTQITPLETKISNNDVMQDDLSLLTTYTASLKSMTSSLSSENSYLKRSTTVTGTSASVTAAAGTTIQDMSIDVANLALKDIYESRNFSSKTAIFTSTDDTIEINIDGETYDIEVDATTTLTQLKDKIFDETDGKVSASILNVGGDDPYKLILQSTNTGEDNAITITSSEGSALSLGLANYTYEGNTPSGSFTGTDTLTFTIDNTGYNIAIDNGDSIIELSNKINLDADLSKLLTASVVDGELILESLDSEMTISSANNLTTPGSGADIVFGLNTLSSPTQDNHIQTATNALFSFSGVDITRDSNSFDDLIVGVSITLNEAGTSNASITQDTEDISTSMESFVSAYNDLMTNLNASIKYDSETGTAGNFQNVSEIKTLKSDINRQLLSVDSEGRSLSEYGVELNRSGILEFDSDIFNTKMSSDSADLESFFRGSTTTYVTSITGSSVAGPVDLTSGDFMINDTEIVVNLNNGSAALNAEALKDAINSANITGVEAILNNDGTGIKLLSNAGYDIAVTGDAAKITSSGLNVGTTYGNSESIDGYFTEFNSLLDAYINGNDSILELYNSQLQTKNSALVAQKEKLTATLDKKYEIMATKFAAYDSIISSLNAQMTSITSMIEAQYADN